MNIFEKFSLSREVIFKEGEITLDKQRVMMIPLNFIMDYSLKIKNNPREARKFYDTIKNGMMTFSMPLGKEYGLSYRDFLDRWVKYTAFAGWGIVKYEAIDTDTNTGFLTIKDFSLDLYLKGRGVKEPSDRLMEAMIAGSLSATFKTDIDVIEAKCICSGNDVCVYHWGPRSYLAKKFPDIVSKRFGD